MNNNCKFQIDFSCLAHGWIDLSLNQGEERCELIISHVLYDPLGELVRAAIWAIDANDGDNYKIPMFLEPQELEIELNLIDQNLEIMIQDSLNYSLNFKEGRPLFQCITDIRRFVTQVQDLMSRVEGLYNPKKEFPDWNHPFPESELKKLKELKRQLLTKNKHH